MKACILESAAPVETNPLAFTEAPVPDPGADEVLVRVRACGVCRTDLHVVEGELPPRKRPVIPGHQVVGTVERCGAEARRFRCGRARGRGVAPSHLRRLRVLPLGARESLRARRHSPAIRWMAAMRSTLSRTKNFVYPIPEGFSDMAAAPLLCAGIIGFRSLRVSGIQPGGTLGLYGFGAAAHVAIQVARHWGVRVYAMTRDERHRQLARELGAEWAGAGDDQPPEKLDAAIIFAPAGELVVSALRVLKKGGTVALGGIYMSPIPAMDYNLLYHERVIRSVANNTRQDGEDFLKIAAEIPIHTQVQEFPAGGGECGAESLKHDAVRGAAVLRVA